MDNPGDIILLLFMMICVLPIVVLFVVGLFVYWFGRRWLGNFTNPDATELVQQYRTMQQTDPEADRDKLVQEVINRQSFKCGMVGLVTGFGGFFTLPLALPFDILLSMRFQATMVNFIAQVYGHENDLDSRIASYMIMSGSGEVTQTTSRVIMKYIVRRLTGRIFSKIIPFIGAGVGFGVNYAVARSIGQTTIAWYQRKAQQATAA